MAGTADSQRRTIDLHTQSFATIEPPIEVTKCDDPRTDLRYGLRMRGLDRGLALQTFVIS
jgi:hypothetical protein